MTRKTKANIYSFSFTLFLFKITKREMLPLNFLWWLVRKGLPGERGEKDKCSKGERSDTGWMQEQKKGYLA